MAAEMNGDDDVDWSGFAVQLRRLVFPLLDGVQGRLMEQSRAGNDFDGADIAAYVDEGVDLDFTRDVLGSGGWRIDRRGRLEKAGLLKVSAEGKRSGRFLAMASGQTGEGILIDRLIDVNGGLGFVAGLRITGTIDNRSGEVDFTDSRLLGLLVRRSIAGSRFGILGGWQSCWRGGCRGVRRRLAMNHR